MHSWAQGLEHEPTDLEVMGSNTRVLDFFLFFLSMQSPFIHKYIVYPGPSRRCTSKEEKVKKIDTWLYRPIKPRMG